MFFHLRRRGRRIRGSDLHPVGNRRRHAFPIIAQGETGFVYCIAAWGNNYRVVCEAVVHTGRRFGLLPSMDDFPRSIGRLQNALGEFLQKELRHTLGIPATLANEGIGIGVLSSVERPQVGFLVEETPQ